MKQKSLSSNFSVSKALTGHADVSVARSGFLVSLVLLSLIIVVVLISDTRGLLA